MKYRFSLPAVPGGRVPDGPNEVVRVDFECETPAENDFGDSGEIVAEFIGRAVRGAREVVAALEKKP